MAMPLDQETYRMMLETAEALEMPVVDLMTYIGYETGGTFDPVQPGPTTKWGRHKGYIQFGEPQAEQYGVDFSTPETARNTQLGKDGAIVKYFKDRGYEPGQTFAQGYSTINAGSPNRLNATDEHVGGAPGTVLDKVNSSTMRDHRSRAEQMYSQLGGAPTARAAESDQRKLGRYFMQQRDVLDTALATVAENRVNDQRQLMSWVDPRNPMFKQFTKNVGEQPTGGALPPMQGPQMMPPVQGPQVPPSPQPRPQPDPTPQPNSAGQPTVSAQGPVDPPVAAEGGAEAGARPWYRTQAFADALSAVGVGLGQINSGQAVDVMPSIAKLRQTRINARTAQQQQEQAAIKEAREAEMFELEKLKVSHELAGGGGRVDYTQAVAAYPQLGGLAALAAQGDKEAQKQFAQSYATLAVDGGGSTGAGTIDALTNYLSAGTAEERINSIAALPPDQQDRVIRLASDVDPNAEKDLPTIRLANKIMELEDAGDYRGAELLRETARLTSGGDVDRSLEIALAKGNLDRGYSWLDNLQEAATTSSAPMPSVLAMEQANDKILNDGGNTSALTQVVGQIGRVVSSVFSPEDVAEFSKNYGYDLLALEQIDNESTALGLIIAKNMMKGQGSVTDGERQQMLVTVGAGSTSVEERARILSRLKALNQIDEKIYNYASSIETGLSEDAGNFRELNRFIGGMQSQVGGLSQAMQNYEMWSKQGGANPVDTSRALPWADGTDPETIVRHMLPPITPEAAKMFFDILPDLPAGPGRKPFIDRTTGAIMEIDRDGQIFNPSEAQ